MVTFALRTFKYMRILVNMQLVCWVLKAFFVLWKHTSLLFVPDTHCLYFSCTSLESHGTKTCMHLQYLVDIKSAEFQVSRRVHLYQRWQLSCLGNVCVTITGGRTDLAWIMPRPWALTAQKRINIWRISSQRFHRIMHNGICSCDVRLLYLPASMKFKCIDE